MMEMPRRAFLKRLGAAAAISQMGGAAAAAIQSTPEAQVFHKYYMRIVVEIPPEYQRWLDAQQDEKRLHHRHSRRFRSAMAKPFKGIRQGDKWRARRMLIGVARPPQPFNFAYDILPQCHRMD